MPISPGKINVNKKAKQSPKPIIPTALLNPNNLYKSPPKKKPTPLRAFLDPVKIATHLKSCFWPVSLPLFVSGTTVLTALLALILFKSFAIPLTA